MGLWHEKPEFEKWNKIVQGLANKIEAKLGSEYKVKWQPKETSGKWGFYAPKNFAYPRRRKKANALRVSTKEEWATRAGVANLADAQHSSNGWHTYPCTFWDLDIDNAGRLEELASILAKVCRARHH